MKISGFDWDKGNINKCTKHGLDRQIIENFFHSPLWIAPDVKHCQTEDRFLAIGVCPLKEKPMVVAFTYRFIDDQCLIRPISARYMHKREAQKYEQAFTKN
jgi:hypothetical protein